MRTLLLFFMSLTAAISCAQETPSTTIKTEGAYRALLKQWVGRSTDELIAAWGKPDSIFPMDGASRKLSTYIWVKEEGATEVVGDEAIPLSCATHFLIDGNNKVVSFRYDGNSCKASVNPSTAAYTGHTFTLRASGRTLDAQTSEYFFPVAFKGVQPLKSDCPNQAGAVPARCVGQEIPAQPMQVQIRGAVFFNKSFTAIDSTQVEGIVSFNPTPDGMYEVRGKLSTAGSTIWIHDLMKDVPATASIQSK